MSSSAAACNVVLCAVLLALLQCNALPSIAAGTLLKRETLVTIALFAFYRRVLRWQKVWYEGYCTLPVAEGRIVVLRTRGTNPWWRSWRRQWW